MVCHVIIPPLTLTFFFFLHLLPVFRSFRMRTVSNYFDAGTNYPAFMFHWIEMLFLLTFLCAVGYLTSGLAFSCHLFLHFFLHKIFCRVRDSFSNKSNLSRWKRKHWKRRYFMVIACDRVGGGGGGEQQRVSFAGRGGGHGSSAPVSSHRLWPGVMEVMEGQKGGAEVARRLQRLESW